MRIKLFLFASTLLLIAGCKNPTGPIELNNGEKWKINAEMIPHLRASESLVSSFSASGLESYKELAEKLDAKNKELITSCNMKGQSHDELHKWLLPYMTSFNELKGAQSIEEAQNLYSEIKQSFLTFNQNFE